MNTGKDGLHRQRRTRSEIQNAIAAVLIACLLAAQPLALAQSPRLAPAPTGASLPEVIEAIEGARVTTRILYVTAHPDDEPGGLLAYLSRGLHADVALLSLTRGEGGQNALGPEQAPQLGVIRTEELLRATQVYGTRLFFTRAKDFGFCKTPEEAIQVWGDQVLDDMVRVIRSFRPHVIINNWGGVTTGHGHHQAAGILTPRAYKMAADPNAFPDQFKEGLRPWEARSLLQLQRQPRARAGETPASSPPGFDLPLNDVSPLWGKSWNEIGVEGYLNHRTQGVGGIRDSSFARRTIRLVRVEGAEPDKEMLASPIVSLAKRFPSRRAQILAQAQSAEAALRSAGSAAVAAKWSSAAQSLSSALQNLSSVRAKMEESRARDSELSFEFARLQERLEEALARVSGIRVSFVADVGEVVPSMSFLVQFSDSCRQGLQCSIEVTDKNAAPRPVESNGARRFLVNPPMVSQSPPAQGMPATWIFPEPSGVAPLEVSATVAGYRMAMRVPILVVKNTSTTSDVVAPVIVPALTVTAAPRQFVLLAGKTPPSLEVVTRVSNYATAATGVQVGIEVPDGWTAPEMQSFDLTQRSSVLARASAGLPENVKPGSYTLRPFAQRGRKYSTSLAPLVTLPSRLWEEPSEVRVHVMDLAVPENLRVGYVAADNDPIPHLLSEIGVHTVLLDELALAFGDLSKFDAICVGIRAYELRQDLIRSNSRLLDYVKEGGTLVVQYQRESVWSQLKPAPYRALGSQNDARVTDENSPVRFLAPKHPVLNFPNGIRGEDFTGWVQERGLYFWVDFDENYTPLLAMKDPSDKEEFRGVLLEAPLGKGHYIFTGLSFFRQLPEGVPGAYRLFVNLLSQSRSGK